MHLGNIWGSGQFRKFDQTWMRIEFGFWNVFRSKNLNLEKRFRTFFVLEDTSINPKSSEWRSHEKIDVRREYYLGRGGWSKLQCVLVCVWRFYFGGARIGSKQPHSKEYPSS